MASKTKSWDEQVNMLSLKHAHSYKILQGKRIDVVPSSEKKNHRQITVNALYKGPLCCINLLNYTKPSLVT